MSNPEEILRDSAGNLSVYEAIEHAMRDPSDPALVRSSKSAGLSPSSASAVVTDPVTKMQFILGNCLRKQYYSIRNQEPDPDRTSTPWFTRICEAGDLISDNFVYKPAMKAGIYAADELRFYDPDNFLSGRLDLMAYIPGTTEKMVVEVKSMGGFSEVPWIKGFQRGFKFPEPRYKDIPQLMSYMQWWLQFGVKYGGLFYCSREMRTNMFCFSWANVPDDAERPHDGAYLRCYSKERTWDLPWLTWGQVRERYMQIIYYLQNEKLPPRDFTLEYSNKYLLELSKHAGKGSQFVNINATDGKKIQSRFRAELKKTKEKDPEKHDTYVKTGSYQCNYCDYQKTCWSTVSDDVKPVSKEEFEQKKTPVPPVATEIKETKPVSKIKRPRV